MRHGQSTSNEENLIVSSAMNGVSGYGLTEAGQQQVIDSAMAWQTHCKSPIILFSDFLRTRETATLTAQQQDGISDFRLETRLREREFGELELGSNSRYAEVWALDEGNPEHNDFQVESVASVVERISLVIKDIEECYQDKQVLLVSHGDVLQILSTLFLNLPMSQHRSVKHLETAEIRQLEIV